MKKLAKLFILPALALLPVLSKAQSMGGYPQRDKEEDRKNNIKVNVLSPLTRTASGFYERKISEHISVQMGASYSGFSISDAKLRSWSATPEMRYYPGNGLNGFYLGPYLRFRNTSVNAPITVPVDAEGTMETKNINGSLTSKGGGLILGYQWLIGNRVSLDVFLGPSISVKSMKANVDDFEEIEEVQEIMDWVDLLQWSGVGLRSGITLGVAF